MENVLLCCQCNLLAHKHACSGASTQSAGLKAEEDMHCAAVTALPLVRALSWQSRPMATVSSRCGMIASQDTNGSWRVSPGGHGFTVGPEGSVLPEGHCRSHASRCPWHKDTTVLRALGSRRGRSRGFGLCRGIPAVWVEGRVAGWLLQPQEDAEMPVEVDGAIVVLGRAPLKQRVCPPMGLLRSRLVGLRAPSMPEVKTTGPRPLRKRDFTPNQSSASGEA